MPDDWAVEVRHLVKKFGDFTAVNDVSFDVRRGEIFGFLGPNGAGKSTTIRMLCGLLSPTSGSGRVAGYDIVHDQWPIKARVGYMSQKFSLYEDLTVAENIRFYGGVYGVPRQRLQERREWILDMANLRGRETSRTGELAMGWKQRLALGCAIVHEPEIVFLDEPTAGVDPVSRRNFWDLIYELSGGGVTVFVTTHYMDEAEHCDRLAMIYAGELIALGTPGELKQQALKGTLLEVLCEPVMPAFDLLKGQPEVMDVAVFGATLHIIVSEAQQGSEVVRRLLTEGGVTVQEIVAIPPSLEDVFVALIQQTDEAKSVAEAASQAPKERE